jgi:hypothetical protein
LIHPDLGMESRSLMATSLTPCHNPAAFDKSELRPAHYHNIMSSMSTPSSNTAATPRQIDQFEDPLHDFATSTPPAGGMGSTEELLCCVACGTQFDVENRSLLKRCRICDDPRQFVPPSGQAFTTLGEMSRKEYRNKWKCLADDDRFWSLWTEPKFAIGQRAILIKTPLGNILWDCITYLDRETVEWINELGGLAAIVISHPHYYTTVSMGHTPQIPFLPLKSVSLPRTPSHPTKPFPFYYVARALKAKCISYHK